MSVVLVRLGGLALLAGALAAAPAAAQGPPPPDVQGTDLQTETKARRIIVLPKPRPETFADDAERAAAEVRSRARPEHALREETTRPSRRPDLDYDVRSGIQGRNLRNALPR
jgi:hypothetical protein